MYPLVQAQVMAARVAYVVGKTGVAINDRMSAAQPRSLMIGIGVVVVLALIFWLYRMATQPFAVSTYPLGSYDPAMLSGSVTRWN